MEPQPIVEDNLYCSTECPFLDRDLTTETVFATCRRDGQELFFYDWFIARCLEGELYGLSALDETGVGDPPSPGVSDAP
jgi:hypothetical protein